MVFVPKFGLEKKVYSEDIEGRGATLKYSRRKSSLTISWTPYQSASLDQVDESTNTEPTCRLSEGLSQAITRFSKLKVWIVPSKRVALDVSVIICPPQASRAWYKLQEQYAPALDKHPTNPHSATSEALTDRAD